MLKFRELEASFLAEKYILREGNKVLKEGEINEKLFEELTRARIKKAILSVKMLYITNFLVKSL